MEGVKETAAYCRRNGTIFKLESALIHCFKLYFTDTFWENIRYQSNVTSNITIAIIKPSSLQTIYIDQFHSKEDFLQAILTSCFLPIYSKGTLLRSYRKGFFIGMKILELILECYDRIVAIIGHAIIL
jgi:hypothetical protein